jgi:hypothetical protein
MTSTARTLAKLRGRPCDAKGGLHGHNFLKRTRRQCGQRWCTLDATGGGESGYLLAVVVAVKNPAT